MEEEFDEGVFQAKVSAALAQVQRVLDVNKHPQYPSDVPHTYADKFMLAETLVNISVAALVNCFAVLGLSRDTLQSLCDIVHSKKRAVTLQLVATERCAFDREEVKHVDSDTQLVVEASFLGKITSKTVTKVTDFFWKFNVDYELFFFEGSDPSEKITLFQRSAVCEIKTKAKESPVPEVVVRQPKAINVTWLLQSLNPEGLNTQFKIDRMRKSCHTPRRNSDVDNALRFFVELHEWCASVNNYFRHQLFSWDVNHKFDLSAINANTVFVPVLPLFVEGNAAEPVDLKQIESDKPDGALVSFDGQLVAQSQVVLKLGEINLFLSEEIRTINEKFEELAKVFAGGEALITPFEAKNITIFTHFCELTRALLAGVNYIEDMMRKQLIAAIGKEIGPVDFAKYMIFHNRKTLKAFAEPKPFCYAIRRPDHFPEGLVSVEVQYPGDVTAEPIYTQVRRLTPEYPMEFAINAATKVAFFGDRFLHAWISQQFSGQQTFQLSLNARARQFSSFVILVGNIGSNTLFLPKFGMIIQNKDDLKIPLLLEQIPTAKEFREAIDSLSPEQQRFAQSYRSMQLESTMFGVCVIQIKPQLEKLLKLPSDSLTKEIRLTQDLMELFITYQIPSDLLSYAGEDDAPASSKVDYVKNQVKMMYEMINASKQKELEEKKQEAEFAVVRSRMVVEEAEQIGGSAMREMEDEIPVKKERKAKKQSKKQSKAKDMEISKSATFDLISEPQSNQFVEVSAPETVKKAETQSEQKIVAIDSPIFDEKVDDVIFTSIPTELDGKLGSLEDSIRPIIITADQTWSKKSQKNLLAAQVEESLNSSKQDQERDRVFDLLDALSRSGSLPFDEASLHVLIGMAHCFDETLLNTLVKQNRNPIERVEQTSLLVASTIQGKPISELLKTDQRERVKSIHPSLLA